MDRILVESLPLRAHVGLGEQERADAQEVLVSLGLHLDLTRAGASDALEDTVDYDAVCAVVEEIVTARPFKLIEAIAHDVAAAVLEAFAVREVEVRVEKPEALRHRGVPFAAVEIRRARDA